MTSGIQKFWAEQKIDVRDFGLVFARMIANMAVDPHGYFEKKYTALIERAGSDSEIYAVLTQLMQWVTSSALTDAERDRLDTQLAAKGLPCISDLRAVLLP